MNIICLDIDDCIYPSNQNYFGKTDDSIELLIINLKRLSMIIEKYNCKVFITSSWYSQLELNDFGEISFKDRGMIIPISRTPYYKEENLVFAQIQFYLDGYVIGLSCGNRETDIRELSKNNKVIIIDDMKLDHLENENCVYCETKGLISNEMGYKINEFLKDEK